MITNNLESILEKSFGYRTFKENQKEIVESMLKGENVFVTLPTGYGKSLCYQLPAVVGKGLTVVISPLIALMRDQVKSLLEKGVCVSFLDSLQSDSEAKREIIKIKIGKSKILYLSPERLNSNVIYNDLRRETIKRLVIDEAHCLSMWGHDFRPSYLKIPIARKMLGNPPIAAFTATAPVCVRDDIIKNLHTKFDFQFHADVDRPNLKFKKEVFHNEKDKEYKLIEILKEAERKEEPTLVYFSKISSLEELSKIADKEKLRHVIYHGKMEREDRINSQNLFMNDTFNLMFATKAFGMGVDKPNIRNVVNFEVPESLEEYYQEAGRAGRDGKKSICTLIYQYDDIKMLRDFVRGANPPLNFIKNIYYRLWSRVEQKNKDLPETFFLRNKFEEEYEKAGSLMKSMALSSVSALEEYGLILTFGKKLIFLKKPSEVTGEKFPISEEVINLKHDYDTQKLKIMVYYATTKEDAKNIILRHFRHNSVVENIRSLAFEDFVEFEPKNINRILLALTEKDYSKRYLPILLSSTKIKSKSLAKGNLEHISSTEIDIGTNRASSIGLIRKVPIRTRTYLTLTKKGIEKLYDERIVSVKPCLDYNSLKERMYNPLEKETLKNSIKDWFKNEADWYSSNSSWDSIREFLVTRFKVLNKKVIGLKLVSDYIKVKREEVRLRDAKQFLNYIFDDSIKY